MSTPNLVATQGGRALTGVAKRLRSSGLERLFQVRSEVVQILDPDREPEQSIEEPHAKAVFTRYGRRRHGGRMAHQALGAAEALGPREQPEAVEHAPPRPERAVPGDERHHAAAHTRLAVPARALRL